MTKFQAKVTQDIPANRLVGLGGINTDGNPEEGWETVYLILSKKGWLPDMVSTLDLEKDSIVTVSVKGNPSWNVEASTDIRAGTLVQSDDEGRVKPYSPKDGNYIGFTTHAVNEGEVVEIVKKFGGPLPTKQVEAMSNTIRTAQDKDYSKMTVDELKSLLDEKGIEYKNNATKKELISLL